MIKKIIIFIAAFAAMLLSNVACQKFDNISRIDTNQSSNVQPTGINISTNNTTSINEIKIQVIPITFKSINELVKRSDAIIVGKVTQVLDPVRIDKAKEGYVRSSVPVYGNISSYIIDVEQSLKGTFLTGDKVKIDENGGLADGYSEIYLPTRDSLEFGNRYVIFIKRLDEFRNREYFENLLMGTYDGFVKIEDGDILPQKNSSVFKVTTFENLINEIDYDIKMQN